MALAHAAQSETLQYHQDNSRWEAAFDRASGHLQQLEVRCSTATEATSKCMPLSYHRSVTVLLFRTACLGACFVKCITLYAYSCDLRTKCLCTMCLSHRRASTLLWLQFHLGIIKQLATAKPALPILYLYLFLYLFLPILPTPSYTYANHCRLPLRRWSRRLPQSLVRELACTHASITSFQPFRWVCC